MALFLQQRTCVTAATQRVQPSRSVVCGAFGDTRPSGGFRINLPPASPAGEVVTYAAGGNPSGSRPGGRGGDGRLGPGQSGEASASSATASFRLDVRVDRPGGGAMRTAPGGMDGGPGSPSSNGTGGGGGQGGDGRSSGSGGFDPGSLVPWILMYAGLAGVAYLGQLFGKSKAVAVTTAPANSAAAAPVKPCCAGKA